MDLLVLMFSLSIGALLLLVLPHGINGDEGSTHKGCQPGWLHYNGNCYYMQGGHINWDDANRKCQSMDAKLPMLDNRDLKNFLHSQLHFSCTDKDEEDCRKRVFENECLTNHDYMATNCRFSCNLCHGFCENVRGDQECKNYAKDDWCDSQLDFMMRNFPKSCGCEGFTDRLWTAKFYVKERHWLWFWKKEEKGPYCGQLDTPTSKLVKGDCSTEAQAGYICEKPEEVFTLPVVDEFHKGCPVGGFGYQEKCYILNEHRLGWYDADKTCATKQGTLASLENRDVLEFVTAELLTYTETSWIGLSRNADSVWQWKNGHTAKYLPWSADYDGTKVGQCVEVETNENVTVFIPASCSKEQPFVCEIPRTGLNYTETGNNTASAVPVVFSNCSKPWEEYGEFCVKYFPDEKTWGDAGAYCDGLRGELVSVHNNDFENVLRRFDQNKSAWIGLWKEDRETRYKWSDCSPFDYTFWADGDSDDRLGKQCIQVDGDTKRWRGMPCNSTTSFVCQVWRGHQSHIALVDDDTTTASPTSPTITATTNMIPATTNKAPTTEQNSDPTPVASTTKTPTTRPAPSPAAPNPTTRTPSSTPTSPNPTPTTGTKVPTPRPNPVTTARNRMNGASTGGKSSKSKAERGESGSHGTPVSEIVGILLGCAVVVFIFAVLFLYISRSSRKRQQLDLTKADNSLSIKYENMSNDDDDDDDPSNSTSGIVNPNFSPITFINHENIDTRMSNNSVSMKNEYKTNVEDDESVPTVGIVNPAYSPTASPKHGGMGTPKTKKSVTFDNEKMSDAVDDRSSSTAGIVNPAYSPITIVNQPKDGKTEESNGALMLDPSRGFDNYAYNTSTA